MIEGYVGAAVLVISIKNRTFAHFSRMLYDVLAKDIFAFL